MGVRGRLVGLAAIAGICVTLAAAQLAGAAPANDAFSAAPVLTGWTVTATGTNASATRETGEPLHGGVTIETGSIWWKWTAPSSGTARIDTIGSDFDTVLGVYTGTSVSALASVAQNDNAYGISTSEVTFAATAGTTYSIAVAGFNYWTGNVQLAINAPRPANDDFANARQLTGPTGSSSATTDRATVESGEPAHWSGPYHSVWYRWTGDVASRVSFATTAPVGASPAVAVYTGTSLGSLTRVAAGGAGATFVPTPGVEYWIAADGSSTGAFTLTWSRPGPTNDNFDTSTFELLRGANGTVESNTSFATKQAGEPSHAGNAGGASVWYLWSPGASGRVRMSTAGSSFDTLLAVYTGSSVGALTPVASNDDAPGTTTSEVTFDVTGGSSLWIAVDGKNGAAGAFKLTWSAIPPANDNLANATPLGASSGSTSANLLGATVEPDEPTAMYEGPTVWWSWTPSSSGVAVADTIGSPGDSTLRIFRGSSMSTLVGVAQDHDSAGGSDATATFVFRAGTRYLIQAATWDGGSVNLNWHVDSPVAPAVPVNDTFASARTITGEIGHVAGTVLGSTNEAGEPAQREGGASVWYRWTAPADGVVYFSLPTLDGTWPAAVDVYRGATLDSLTLEDVGTVYGAGAVMAIAGQTYSIRVRSTSGFGRSFVLDWNRDQPSPPNDSFSAAQTLTGASGAVSTSTYNATSEADEPSHGSSSGASVWYRWTAPAAATVQFGVNASTAAIDVFTGDSIRSLTRATIGDGGPATFSTQPGVTYSIAVVGGPFHATLTWGAPSGSSSVPNDAFAAATVLGADHGTLTGTNVGATSEGGEPAATQWASVWFRFTAPATGTYVFDTFGSGFDTVLGAYSGAAVGALTSLGFNNDAGGATTSLVSVGAQAGTVIWIAAGSNGQYAPRGAVTLNWKRAYTTPPNDAFASPTVVSGASGSLTGSNVGASKEPGEPNHAGKTGGASVWYSWTAPQSGAFVFQATNPALGTQLAVYTGTALSSLTAVAATEGSGGTSRVRFNATAGSVYRVAVDGWFDDGTTQRVDTGSFNLTWSTRPDNDDWARARAVDPSATAASSSLVGATLEPGEPTNGWNGPSVWFALTPPASGVYSVSVDSTSSTVLDVWTGGSLTGLTRITGYDGSGSPAVSLAASAGTTYYIRVALKYGDPQPVTLRWSRGGPDNDNFVAARRISALLQNGAWTQAVNAAAANAGATREGGEPLHAGQSGGASIWWTFTAPVTGYVSVDTAGSSFDTLLGVYTGSSVSTLTPVAADDDGAGAGTSRAVFWAQANTVYAIAVDGKAGAIGNVRLRVQPANPANDAFASAQTVTGLSGALTANNNGATKEAGEPNHGGDPGGHSLWYRWTAPASGSFVFDVGADDFGALLGIYTGSSVGGLTPVASAAGSEFGGATARAGITAGVTYMIAVDGSALGIQTGQVRLSWRQDTTATSNDLFAGAQTLAGWSGTLTGTNAGASSEAGEPRIGVGDTLWYRWTAPADGAVAFDVEHPFDGVAVESVGALYVGPSVGSLVRVSGSSGTVHQRVVGGTTYWLQIDSLYDGSAFKLTWRPLSPPANDDFAAATALTADHLSLLGSLDGATRERGEPAHGTTPTDTVSVWYRWTAPRAGRVTIDLRPESIDDPSGTALLSVYTGSSLGTLARVTGSEEWWGRDVAARLHFDAVAGSTYAIAVAAWPGYDYLRPQFRLNLALPPANDAFAAAQAIQGASGTVTGSNRGATKEAAEPDHSGNKGGASIWYRWTAPADGTVVFDTVRSVPDTLLAAYTGSSVSSLVEVARDDQAGGVNDARLVFDVVAGRTYSIALDGFYGPYLFTGYADTDSGDVVLNWRMSPSNDSFSGAERIDDRSGRIAGSTVGATKETGEPTHAGDVGGHSIWYSWTPGATGDVTIDTSGSSFDTLLAVYTGASVGSLTQVIANDDADGLRTSHARFHAVAGVTYAIAVDGKAGATGRSFLQWRLEGAPSNDDLVNALPLAGTTGTVLVDNTWATKEQAEPAHAGVAGGASVWFSWTSPVTARVTFDTRGALQDTVLGVYAGTDYATLSQVAANDDLSASDKTSAVSFSAVAGTTYLVAVDTRNGVYGSFGLWWNRPPDNDDRLIPHALFGATGTYTQTNWWATAQLDERPIAGSSGGVSVWFSWTAPASGTVTFDTVGSNIDTLLALYPDNYYNWAQLAADDDSGGSGTSRVSFAVTAGTAYTIAVDGKSRAMGTVQLHWTLPVTTPANDSFAAAYTLTGAGASSSTVCSPCTTLGATTETGEAAHDGAGHSVWFKWTAPSSGVVALTAQTGQWDLASSVDAYTGTTVGTLTRVAHAPAAGYESETNFKVTAGTTYAFAVDTRSAQASGTDAGAVGLTLSLAGSVPSNDDFAAAQAITGDSGSVSGTSAGASQQAGEPQNGGGRTVWYRWTPSAGGRVTLTPTASGSFYDFPRVAVYTGSSLGALSRLPVDVAPNPNWPQPAPFRFRVDAGVTYYLQVDGSNPTPGAPESGPFTLQWSTLAGDYFSGPVPLTGASGTVRTNTTLATKEPGEPAHARNVGGHSVWFSWTPSVGGAVTIDTAGTAFDSVVAVYTGSSLGALTEVASADDGPGRSAAALTFTAVAGATYRVALDGYSGAAGDAVLAWSTAGVAADATPPVVSLSTPAAGASVGGQVSIAADASDNVSVAQVEFFADGVSLGVDTTAPYSALWQTTSHAAGPASLTARATDGAGNATTSAARTVTVDNVAPTASITSRPVSPNSSTTSTFAFTSNETGATFQCRLDTGTWSACTSPASYTVPAGDHWFYVQAVDRAGNIGSYDSANWTQVGPPPNDAFANGQVLAASSGTVTGTTQNATKETGEPNHGGNAGGHSIWYRWTAPAAGTVTLATSSSTFDTLLAVYTGTAVNALTLIAQNDDVSSSDRTSRLTFSAVAGTAYRIAIDGYGGAAGSTSLTWSGPAATVDTTPPETTITGGPSGTTNATSASFTFSATETATFQCRLDGAAWASCTSPRAVSGLAAGSHTFDVRATDTAGNVDASPATRTWGIDTTAPDTTIASGPSGTVTATTASFSFSATETATFGCRLDGAAFAACTSPKDYSALAAGSHTFEVRATDTAGNLDATPATRTWTVSAPTTSSNDNFVNAAALAGATGSTTGTTVGMTKETGEPNHAGNSGGHSIWFTWVAPGAGSVTINTTGSAFDTLLAVYTGTSVTALTTVASNDDANGATQSSVTFNAVSGTTYRVAVDGYGGATGAVKLAWSQGAAASGPANDAFASAAVLSGTAGGTTVGATKEAGEPNHAGNAGGKSIWWSWTAPIAGATTLTTAGSSYDTLLAVYTGSALSALTAVASNDDANGTTQSQVGFTAVAGTTYRIAVDGYGGASGSVAIRVSQP